MSLLAEFEKAQAVLEQNAERLLKRKQEIADSKAFIEFVREVDASSATALSTSLIETGRILIPQRLEKQVCGLYDEYEKARLKRKR